MPVNNASFCTPKFSVCGVLRNYATVCVAQLCGFSVNLFSDTKLLALTAINDSCDKLIVGRLCAGDEMAFDALYKMYSERLLGYLLKLVKVETIACDLLQVVFMKVWNNRDHIDSNLSFRSYLFQIAENTAYDFFRKAARDKKIQKQLIEKATSQYNHVEESLISKEDVQLLHTAMDSLPPQRRQVFQLVKMEGRSYADVSKELNISTSTISDHIVKATKFIRQRLEKEQSVALGILLFYLLNK